jgi:hypothetical protein
MYICMYVAVVTAALAQDAKSRNAKAASAAAEEGACASTHTDKHSGLGRIRRVVMVEKATHDQIGYFIYTYACVYVYMYVFHMLAYVILIYICLYVCMSYITIFSAWSWLRSLLM